MKAYHFLKADMTAGSGDEKPWEINEARKVKPDKVELCSYGYHSSPSLWAALQYAPGPVACLVDISKPVAKDETKAVSSRRKLIKAVNIEKGLRLFAADCAERVLYIFERARPNDVRPRNAIEAARDYADGKIGDAARTAARTAARAAAWAAAWDAAQDAARAVARNVARDAARNAETKWQREHFEKMFGNIFNKQEEER